MGPSQRNVDWDFQYRILSTLEKEPRNYAGTSTENRQPSGLADWGLIKAISPTRDLLAAAFDLWGAEMLSHFVETGRCHWSYRIDRCSRCTGGRTLYFACDGDTVWSTHIDTFFSHRNFVPVCGSLLPAIWIVDPMRGNSRSSPASYIRFRGNQVSYTH